MDILQVSCSLSLWCSLLWLYPVNTGFLGLSRPSALSPQLRECARALLQFPLPALWLGNFQSSKLGSSRASFICFPSPFSSLLGVHCFENHCFIFFLFYCSCCCHCFRQSKSSPCYSISVKRRIFWSWLEIENTRRNPFLAMGRVFSNSIYYLSIWVIQHPLR